MSAGGTVNKPVNVGVNFKQQQKTQTGECDNLFKNISPTAEKKKLFSGVFLVIVVRTVNRIPLWSIAYHHGVVGQPFGRIPGVRREDE